MLSPEQLKVLRIRLDLTQEEVGIVYNCNKAYVSMMENRKEPFYTEEKYKEYVDAMYKAQQLKQSGEMQELINGKRTEDKAKQQEREAQKAEKERLEKEKSRSQKSTTKNKK